MAKESVEAVGVVKVKRFTKGVKIVSIHTLIQELYLERWVFYRNKPLYPNFVGNMPFKTVIEGIQAGIFYQAKDRQDKP